MRYRLLAENTLDIIWEMGPDLTLTYANPAIEKVTGHPVQEFVGSHLREHVGPDELRRLERVVQDEVARGPAGDGVVVEVDLFRKDGSRVPAEVHGRVIFSDDGRPLAIQGTTRDISRRRALEAELRQSQKLQAIGTFAGGVAHEINNPIMGIANYAEIIAEITAGDPKTQTYCSEIQRETTRIHGLVKDLLGYARDDQEQAPVPAALSSVVESTLSLVRTAMRHDQITLDLDLPDDLPEICCRHQQLQQVVMNLVTNARDALNDKYPNTADNKRITISSQLVDKQGKRWLRLSVEDQGAGISKDVQQRMFDPFFTTKRDGKGTGLGMWIVHRIVRDHGGEIHVETEPGEFTRFNVDLPAA
jgi:PAS domain S-box-containing protein